MPIGGPDAIGLGKPFDLRFEPIQDLREPEQPELLAEPGPKVGESFDDLLGKAVDRVNGEHLKADEKVEGFLRGDNVSTHDVMIQLAKADTSLKLMVATTNKVIEAYHEIARLQI
ncbi:MAG: hypothetical protein AMXMBFR64_49460 [Myxococcales bacterium]